ncbi:MAG: protoporphyrinogen oxidase [Actinomycetia bacterium]|nr:protoporphyrinogen oxidase [Actinomycetes bacterium]
MGDRELDTKHNPAPAGRSHGRNVVVVGGGIAGLSTAYYLQTGAAEAGLDITYTVLEAADRWGGKIATERVSAGGGEFVVEAAADSFINQKPWALQLTRSIGITDELLPTNDHRRKTLVLRKGRPAPLPDGVLLIVPTKFMPFVRSRLISPLGKLRMGLDLVIRAKDDDEDETLAQFIKRRLGSEALDRIAEPLLSGIHNADAQMQSIMATFPRFRELEKNHGSLIKGMLAAQRARAKASGGMPDAAADTTPVSMFSSFNDGTQTLVDAVRSKLTGDCRLKSSITSISKTDDGLCVQLGDGSTLDADDVVLATPAFTSADLLADLAPDAAELLDTVRYVSTGTVSIGYRRSDVEHPLDGFGIVIPSSEKRRINAITWTSTKFDRRAPDDHVLIRVFFGGSRTPEMMNVDDAELMDAVRCELDAIMGLDADPVFHRIFRWWRSNAQYDVGHLEKVDAIEAALPEGIHVTGSAYRGVGIPDCVHQAQQTAQHIVSS